MAVSEKGSSASERNAPIESPRSPDAVEAEKDLEQSTPDANSDERSHDSGQSKDDGYEVTWDGDKDPQNPKNMPKPRKWAILITVALTSLCVTCNSTMYTFTYDQIEPDFGVSREVATLGLSIFVVGLATGPMFLAPMSEFYGRRIVYLCALTFVILFIIPCAVAQNIQTIIVTRFFDGVASSAFLSVAGGTIGDIFNKEELSLPMMIYSGSPFLGPALGPLIAGFINQYISWRWTFWVLLIWTGVNLTAIFILIPETYHPVLLRRKAQRLRKDTGNSAWHAPIEKLSRSIPRTLYFSCSRPFQLMFLEPMVLLLCLLSSLLLGILYLFFGAFPLIFENNHDFTLSQVGMSFLGLATGMVIGVCSDLLFQRNYQRLLRNREKATGEIGVTEPEFRLPPTIVGAQLVWIGLFGFGWTTFSSVPWIAPILFGIPVGCGIVICYAGIFTFLVESYPVYAASALGANAIMRGIFAAVFPLFGVQMYENLGYQWATSLLAFLTLALAPFPYIFFRYGKRIRAHSKFAKKSGS